VQERDELVQRFGDYSAKVMLLFGARSGSRMLAHELMRRAYVGVGVTLEPFKYQHEVIAFANEQLRTVDRGQSRAFAEGFLRLWRAERLGRTSNTTR
jgi:hypothetical protein